MIKWQNEKIKRLMGLSRWGWANMLFFQLFFIRLEREVEGDGSLAALNVIGPIVPFTGWWSEYVPSNFKRLKIWSRSGA